MYHWLSGLMLASSVAGFIMCAKPKSSPARLGREAGSTDGRVQAGCRTPVAAIAGMAVMLVAMVDISVGWVGFLPDVVWGLILLPAAPLLLAGQNFFVRTAQTRFDTHRSMSMIAMAALILVGGHGDHAAPITVHAHGGVGFLPVLVGTGLAALLAYTAVLMVAQPRNLHRSGLGPKLPASSPPVWEAFFTAVSVVAMAGMVFV
jgi:hypothetical protein